MTLIEVPKPFSQMSISDLMKLTEQRIGCRVHRIWMDYDGLWATTEEDMKLKIMLRISNGTRKKACTNRILEMGLDYGVYGNLSSIINQLKWLGLIECDNGELYEKRWINENNMTQEIL